MSLPLTSTTVEIPTDLEPGWHTLEATGPMPGGGTQTLSWRFYVPGSGALPTTGFGAGEVAAAGATMIMLGTASILLGVLWQVRRRRLLPHLTTAASRARRCL